MADYSSWAVRSVRFILYIRISLHWISALPLVIDVLFGIDALYTGCCASLLPIPRLVASCSEGATSSGALLLLRHPGASFICQLACRASLLAMFQQKLGYCLASHF